MPHLAANWPFLLLNQIVRGKFLIQPEIAFAMAPMVLDLIEGNTQKGRTRSMELSVIGNTLAGHDFRKAFILDDDESEAEAGPGSIYDEAPKGSVAIIPLKGSMMKYGSWCDYGTTEIAGMMVEAANHKNIGSIVLDIDSGGGAVDAIAPMVDAIRYTKNTMGKPVLSSVDLCCSAALWTASETNLIVADNNVSAEIGSIGVMMSFMDLREYYEKQGIKIHEIYSSLSADKNGTYREARDGKYEAIQEKDLDPLAVSFQNTIKKNRSGKLDESVEGILSGATYSADDAKKYGLIDRVGSRSSAIEMAMAMSHAKHS